MDVLDTLSIPFYGVAGALDSRSSIIDSIKSRNNVSDVLGVENPFAAFAVDVLTDPLTYTGIGALTKVKGANALKSGSLATTLAGQSAAGQRALVTAFGRPVIQGQKVFQGLTRGAEALKQTVPGVSTALTRLGGRPALSSLSHGTSSSFREIESAATKFETAKQALKANSRATQSMIDTWNAVTSAAEKAIKDLAKETGQDSAVLAKRLTDKFYDSSIHLTPRLQDAYKEMKQLSDGVHVAECFS